MTSVVTAVSSMDLDARRRALRLTAKAVEIIKQFSDLSNEDVAYVIDQIEAIMRLRAERHQQVAQPPV